MDDLKHGKVALAHLHHRVRRRHKVSLTIGSVLIVLNRRPPRNLTVGGMRMHGKLKINIVIAEWAPCETSAG